MKIFIDCGHDHILIQRMLPYWKECGVEVSHNSTVGCDVHLSFTHFITSSDLPKVLRLDGVYYDKATDYKSRNSNLNSSIKIANGVIYQSKFSKEWCQKYLESNNTVLMNEIIYNGIEPNWCGDHITNSVFDILIISNWRRWKRLKEMTQVFLEFNKLHPDSHLHVIGVPDYKVLSNVITYYGSLSHEASKNVFRLSDASMHLAKRDWCPNSLIETLGAGIPVIVTNAEGGAYEIAAELCNLNYAIGELHTNEELYQYTDAYNKISDITMETAVNELCRYYESGFRVSLSEELHIRNVAERYLKFIIKVAKL